MEWYVTVFYIIGLVAFSGLAIAVWVFLFIVIKEEIFDKREEQNG